MKTLRKLLPLLILVSLNSYALVDYSETAPDPSNPQKNKSSMQLQAPKNESRSLIWKSDFSFNTNYESMEIKSEKIGLINLNTHLQTPFNVFFDATYWTAMAKTSNQKGNPKLIMGFNWLRLGSPSDEARLDIFGGVKLPSTSELGSSRTDKIFGAETTKRFGTFGLGIGYDLTLVGTPKNAKDMSIGNINRILISGGWMVSNDIQFELEVENFNIVQASDNLRSNYLSKNISFSTLTPKLCLTLAPSVNLEMGARFNSNKPKSEQDLATAKLLDLHGAYTNSLFVGLNLNL